MKESCEHKHVWLPPLASFPHNLPAPAHEATCAWQPTPPHDGLTCTTAVTLSRVGPKSTQNIILTNSKVYKWQKHLRPIPKWTAKSFFEYLQNWPCAPGVQNWTFVSQNGHIWFNSYIKWVYLIYKVIVPEHLFCSYPDTFNLLKSFLSLSDNSKKNWSQHFAKMGPKRGKWVNLPSFQSIGRKTVISFPTPPFFAQLDSFFALSDTSENPLPQIWSLGVPKWFQKGKYG